MSVLFMECLEFFVCSSVYYQLKNDHRCQVQIINMLHSCTIFFFKTMGVCLSEMVSGMALLMDVGLLREMLYHVYGRNQN